jgi:hypothetical protein
MPSGDAQRVWFPEMIDRLRQQCRETMPFPALIELCRSLDAVLQRIRSERNILSPVMRCRRCGTVARMAKSHVSVRATILALGQFGIASGTESKRLERKWAKCRKQEELNLFGKNAPQLPPSPACSHR